MSNTTDIAIVGGGAAGTLLAVQLAMQAKKPLRLTLCDETGAFARGVAYGTTDPSHMLNVRADRMGAFSDRPDDFYRWLTVHEAAWRKARPALSTLRLVPEGFMPRQLYGDYIASLLANAEKNHPQVIIETIALEVQNATFGKEGARLTLAGGKELNARALVLAIGNLPIRKLSNEEALVASGRYAGPIWEAPSGSILTRKSFTEQDAPVLIIGTGLTMIDALLSLRRNGYEGKVITASGNAQLPQPHFYETPAYPRFLTPESAPRTGFELFCAIRNEVRKAERQGKDWRGVVDSLRADTPALWAALPEKERRKLTRAIPFWGTHRHRMPPESATMTTREMGRGTLEILKGRVRHIEPAHDCLKVELAGRKAPLVVAHALNCSGPETDIRRSRNTLLQALLDGGIIHQGPLRMGIAADSQYRARGNAEFPLFVIGPQLLGERFETVAVPELRQQAEALAKSLLAAM